MLRYLSIGQLVKPLAGRDKNRWMVVVEVIDEDYVLLADGKMRKVEKPKKKKIKHLSKSNTIFEDILQQIIQGNLTNHAIRKKIAVQNGEDKDKGDEKSDI